MFRNRIIDSLFGCIKPRNATESKASDVCVTGAIEDSRPAFVESEIMIDNSSFFAKRVVKRSSRSGKDSDFEALDIARCKIQEHIDRVPISKASYDQKAYSKAIEEFVVLLAQTTFGSDVRVYRNDLECLCANIGNIRIEWWDLEINRCWVMYIKRDNNLIASVMDSGDPNGIKFEVYADDPPPEEVKPVVNSGKYVGDGLWQNLNVAHIKSLLSCIANEYASVRVQA